MVGKLVLTDKLMLKTSVKKLVDNNSNSVATDPLDPLDDHVLAVSFNRCIADNGIPTNCQHAVTVYVRLDFTATKKGGKASATVDLSGVFSADPPGTTIGIEGASVGAGMVSPASCPTGNGPADIAGRVNDADCEPFLPYALFGIMKP
jgi:hypothetical protein